VTTEGLRDLLEFAVEVAWRAGRATLGHFQTGVAAETKPDRTPVTVADRAAEMIARDLIRARYPHDGIVGEEMGDERPGSNRRWILDPIDGTRSFVRGVPLFGVLIALEDEGDAVLGVAHFPALQETVCAARGLGCWWNGRRAIVSGVTRMDDALALTSDSEMAPGAGRGPSWDRLRARVGMIRTWGDCYGYALVATGRAEAMLDPTLSVWDAAAVRPLVEEAGGVVTDWDGTQDHRNGSLVATNAALAREIRSILSG
jgi:histidinol-phosphatase